MTRDEAKAVLLEACKDHMKRSIDIVIGDLVSDDRLKQSIERARRGLAEARLFYAAASAEIDQEFKE